MEKLNKDWITNGLIDAEYKRYIMLAYLQTVADVFRQNKLYPQFAEVIAHHEMLLKLKSSQDALQQVFPKRISGVNPKSPRFEYISLLPETEEMKHIREIVETAIPAFQKVLEEGRSIFEFVEEQLYIEPVGLLPLYKREGYVLLHDASANDVLIYSYVLGRIQRSDATYSTLVTKFIRRERISIAKTFEAIKHQLVQTFPEWPNPAVFRVETQFRFPLVETYLPVTKRLLMQRLHEAA